MTEGGKCTRTDRRGRERNQRGIGQNSEGYLEPPFFCDSKPSGKLTMRSDGLQGRCSYFFLCFPSLSSFSFASFLSFFDRHWKWCTREILNMIGGAWRAEKAMRTKATWEFVETWQVFGLPKAMEMGAWCQFYLYSQGERVFPTDIWVSFSLSPLPLYSTGAAHCISTVHMHCNF